VTQKTPIPPICRGFALKTEEVGLIRQRRSSPIALSGRDGCGASFEGPAIAPAGNEMRFPTLTRLGLVELVCHGRVVQRSHAEMLNRVIDL